MKHLYLILALAFGLNTYAQHPELPDQTWYMQKLVIDGTDHFPPSNEEVSYVMIQFPDILPLYLDTGVCNYFGGEVEFQGIDSFTMLHYEMTLIECDQVVNSSFEGLYFGFFFDADFNLLEDPFPYTITGSGDEMTLVITNVRGDEAIYGNEQLSNAAWEAVPFTLYPNPVTDRLTVQNNKGSGDGAALRVLDVSGKEVLTGVMDTGTPQSSLDVGALHTGMYFLELTNSRGNTQVVKFVKK
mgnify:CR=1 FL=1|tara:strand:+ start:18329 stop:19054 length:726 start_codon:yes stop_codon:yes gene_type:complete